MLPKAIASAIAAHGGAARWNGIAVVEATISARGFLFTAKRRPPLERVRVRAWTREVRLAFLDFPRAGETSELLGDAEVRVVRDDGTVPAQRTKPRAEFSNWRKQFAWDLLDFVYFGGYATWNYLTTPFVFLRAGFAFEELAPLATAEGPWSRVRVHFPADIPTHSRVQVFHFDSLHRLRRLDYTAEVVGRWARAAHRCDAYRDFDGLQVPTLRTVLPLPFGSTPLPGPTLVALTVHDFRALT